MFGIVQFPLFVLAVLALNATPGPDIAYVAGQSMVHGRRAGVVSALGVAMGGCIHTVLCAVGLTALIAASPSAFTAVKYLGGGYLIYLGVRMVLTRAMASDASLIPPLIATRTLLLRGLLTNAFNPKVLLFYLAFFPQFVSPDSTDKAYAFLTLGVVCVVLGFINDVVIACLAAKASQAVTKQPKVKMWMDRVIGMAFVGLGIRLMLSRRG